MDLLTRCAFETYSYTPKSEYNMDYTNDYNSYAYAYESYAYDTYSYAYENNQDYSYS